MAEQPVEVGIQMMMRSRLARLCLSLILAGSLIVTFPQLALASTCPQSTCIYLPLIVRPPYLVFWHGGPYPAGKDSEVLVVVQNTSGLTLKNIVWQWFGKDPYGTTYFYTRTIAGNPILAPDESVDFTLLLVIGGRYPPLSSISELTWTVALPSESQPVSVTSFLISSFKRDDGYFQTHFTATLKNPVSQTLSNISFTIWGDPSLRPTSRYPVGTLLPGQISILSEELDWLTTQAISPNAVRVSAHGVILP